MIKKIRKSGKESFSKKLWVKPTNVIPKKIKRWLKDWKSTKASLACYQSEAYDCTKSPRSEVRRHVRAIKIIALIGTRFQTFVISFGKKYKKVESFWMQ